MNNFISPDWPAPFNIKAISTTRLGGFSKLAYQGFNLGDHVGDDPTAVAQNRKLLREELSLITEPMWLSQVHGNQIINIDKTVDINSEKSRQLNYSADKDYSKANIELNSVCNSAAPIADGAFTQQSNIICTVMTGDCLPIILCDRAGKSVAALHGGWRSLAAGIIEKAMLLFATPGKEILAWLGPAIGPEVYEVGDDVRDEFINRFSDAAAGFKSIKPNKWLCNLYLLAQQQLNHHSVTAIYGGNYCTYSDNERFFSARRDKNTGRMATLIWKEK